MDGEFERALARTEADALATQRAAEAVVKAARRVVASARTGDVGALERGIAETERNVQSLRLQCTNTSDGWALDLPEYIEGGGLLEEVMEAARGAGLKLYEQDGRIFSYPHLVRIAGSRTSADCAVIIDKKRSKSLRPSFLMRQLIAARDRPPKFDAKSFLKSLYEAYSWAERARGATQASAWGPVIELVDVYDLLTLFPGQAKDYSKQEFTRDLFLLDRSGLSETAAGARMELSASTGTKGSKSRLLRLVDEEGREKFYYAIAFSRPQRP
ncbi:MAG: hypothetical protein HYX53_10480 [Chloroflexi bacterium]|nr:hypothetical protein [Chloroflexota bacterium]